MIRNLLFVVACCTFASTTQYENERNKLRELELLLKRTDELPKGEILIVGQPTGQSSTYVHQGQPLSADLANDGNSDSNLHEGRSCTHTTQTDDNPWWWVDIGNPYVIGKVEIVNRGDCCSDRLEGATVHVALDKDQALRQQSSDQCGSPVTADQASVSGGTVSIECSRPVQGQFVVIGKPGGNVVSLCEVKVYEDRNDELWIIGRPTDQSSTYIYKGQPLSADLANDGSSDPNLDVGRSCSLTKSSDNPWWIVDLENVHFISRVAIANRGDCCAERLEGETVYVALDKDQALLQQSSDQCGSPVTADQASVLGGTVVVKCDPLIKGQYIVIGLPGSSVVLQFCEIRVWEFIPLWN